MHIKTLVGSFLAMALASFVATAAYAGDSPDTDKVYNPRTQGIGIQTTAFPKPSHTFALHLSDSGVGLTNGRFSFDVNFPSVQSFQKEQVLVFSFHFGKS